MQDQPKDLRKMNEYCLKGAILCAQQELSGRYAQDAIKNLEAAFLQDREDIMATIGSEKRFVATYAMAVFLCSIFEIVDWEIRKDPTEKELFLFEVVESIQKVSELLLQQQLNFCNGGQGEIDN